MKNNIDVENFIVENYQEYTGDDKFLSGPTERTTKIINKVELLAKEELQKGVLDIETERNFSRPLFSRFYENSNTVNI